MGLLANRIPSRRELILLFTACSIPIHLLGILQFLYQFPAYRLRLNIGEIIGLGGYVLTIIMFENMFVLFALFVLGMFIPRRLWNENFIVKGSMWIFLTFFYSFIFFIIIESGPQVVVALGSTWASILLLVVIASYILLVVWLFFYVHRYRKIGLWVLKFFERFVPVVGFYLLLDVVGFVIVLIRNIT